MSEVRVAVVGAGMAGLTAALRLAERGYKVTVYEERSYVGGQFSAHTHDDPPTPASCYHEHSYHMLLNWYNNFWQIVEDIGLDREWHFEPRTAIRHLAPGVFADWSGRAGHGAAGGRDVGPKMPALVNAGSATYAWRNLFSGIAPPPDMFLYSYSLIDLLSQSFDPERLLDQYTVNSFLQSRPYASDWSAELHEHTLAKAFASPSYLSSAASYQSLIKYGFPCPEPMMWILKGDTQRHFHDFLEAKLQASRCCEIKRLHRVTGIDVKLGGSIAATRAIAISYVELEKEDWKIECVVGDYTAAEQFAVSAPVSARIPLTGRGAEQRKEYDHVILAVPPGALSKLVIRDVQRTRPTDTDPVILSLRRQLLQFFPRLKTQSMASLDLYFRRRLPGIPKEHVVLLGSEFGLTLVDNSQAWPGHPNTVLNVVASDFGSLSHLLPAHAQVMIVQDLKRYIPFDEYRDLDLERTHFQTNVGDRLFLNEVGSLQWRPAAETLLPNLFLAGDYCRTVVDVVTIEGAVMSGLQAAKALQQRVISEQRLRPGDRLAESIAITEPEAYSEAEMATLKLLLAPYAYVAKAWSWLYERATPLAFAGVAPASAGSRSDLMAAPADLFADGMQLVFTPWVMAADFWRAGWSMWSGMFGRSGFDR